MKTPTSSSNDSSELQLTEFHTAEILNKDNKNSSSNMDEAESRDKTEKAESIVMDKAENRESIVLDFTRLTKNGKNSYRFESFENIIPKWKLPCEYICGVHFTVWDSVLLYSDGNSVKALSPGTELAEKEYLELMKIVEQGKKRLKGILNRMNTLGKF